MSASRSSASGAGTFLAGACLAILSQLFVAVGEGHLNAAPPDLTKNADVFTQPPRLDLAGDPLPPGALARLGTVRGRYGFVVGIGKNLNDGVTRLVGIRNEIRWIDRATGRTKDSWTLPKGYYLLSFSADGRIAAAKHENDVEIWNISARKLERKLRLKVPFGPDLYLVFSDDGKTLLVSTGAMAVYGLIRVFDVATGDELWHDGITGDSEKGLDPLGFPPDGKTIALVNRVDSRATLRELATGREIRTFQIAPRNEVRRVGLSPDGKMIFVGTSGPAVRVWEIETGRELAPLGGHESQAYTYGFSDDGKTVLTGGGDSFILVHDFPTGKVRQKIELGKGKSVAGLSVSMDGRRAEALLFGENAARSFDLTTGKEMPATVNGHLGNVLEVFFSSDGKTVISGACDNTIRCWESATGRQLRSVTTDYPDTISMLDLSSDRKLLATANLNRGTVALRSANDGRLLRRIETGEKSIGRVFFAPDSHSLAIGVPAPGSSDKAFLGIWNAENGEAAWRFNGIGDNPACFSPDGRFLAVSNIRSIFIHSAKTGAAMFELKQPKVAMTPVFSHDGRTLACTAPDGINLWELTTRKVRFHIDIALHSIQKPAISPDGRWLAYGDELAIHLWDKTSATELRTITGHDAPITCLAFSPDSKILASGSFDTTILLWDFAALTTRQPGAPPLLDDRAIDSAWERLASPDAAEAYKAALVLQSDPKKSMPWLADHLKSTVPPNITQIQGWLAELGDSRYAIRERATRSLENLGDPASGEIRRFLAGNISAESRQRANSILEKIEGPGMDSDLLRSIRTIEMLELIGNPNAIQLLKKLAAGYVDSRQTLEATASLSRLTHKSKNAR